MISLHPKYVTVSFLKSCGVSPSVTTSILPVWQLRGVCFWAWNPWGRLHERNAARFQAHPISSMPFSLIFQVHKSWNLRVLTPPNLEIMLLILNSSYSRRVTVQQWMRCTPVISSPKYVFKDTWYTFRISPLDPQWPTYQDAGIITFPPLANCGFEIPKRGKYQRNGSKKLLGSPKNGTPLIWIGIFYIIGFKLGIIYVGV